MNLGAEALAEALLDLTGKTDIADDLVERMLATPKENIQRFRKKLDSLKRTRRFVRWSASSGLARDLESLLEDIKAGISDPFKGVELIASFYKTDKGTLAHCDDSSGVVGDVYRFTARKLFVEYASRCSEKAKISKIVIKLNENDGYGVRDALIDCAGEYLSENDIRFMIAQFLIAIGNVDAAEKYILERADQIHGEFYDMLLSLVKTMEAEDRHLAVSIIYRKLLNSILKRGYTKAYPYGARYLRKLDELAVLILDWRKFDDHETYKKQIFEKHYRKTSFWSKYE